MSSSGAGAPIGPVGPKGDPGGIVQAAVAAATDCNNILIEGAYRLTDGTTGKLALNYPKDYFIGSLIVLARTVSTRLTQIAYPQFGDGSEGRVHYERGQYSNGTWTAWRVYSSTRTDQTAGRAFYQWDDLNNREQLAYGDTGLREVSSLVNAAFFDNTGATRKIHLRRYGSQVEMTGQFLLTASTSDVGAITVPSGYAPQYIVNGYVTAIGGTTRLIRVYSLVGSSVINLKADIGGAGLVAGDVCSVTLTWQTLQAWPTSLPGAASGTIPNT